MLSLVLDSFWPKYTVRVFLLCICTVPCIMWFCFLIKASRECGSTDDNDNDTKLLIHMYIYGHSHYQFIHLSHSPVWLIWVKFTLFKFILNYLPLTCWYPSNHLAIYQQHILFMLSGMLPLNAFIYQCKALNQSQIHIVHLCLWYLRPDLTPALGLLFWERPVQIWFRKINSLFAAKCS